MSNTIKTVLFNLLTTLILIVVIEAFLAFLMHHPSWIPGIGRPYFRQHYQANDRSIMQVSECGQYDSVLFYKLRPGSCIFENYEFSTQVNVNHVGLRDDEESLNYPQMLFLGDSHTIGWGVGEGECFPQVLGEQTSIRGLNAGMSSYGTARQMILLKRLMLDSVRVVVIQYHENDFEENTTFLENNFNLPVRSSQEYDSIKALHGHRTDYYPFKHLYGLTKAVGLRMARGERPIRNAVEEATLFLRILDRHAPALGNARIIVLKMDLIKFLNDDFANAVDSLKSTSQFPNLRNVETLRISNVLNEDDFFILDEHMNTRGHKKIADALRRQILQEAVTDF